MDKNRLEAFSDGVLAIIITIMVLELKAPHEADLKALAPLIPVLSTYLLSFVYVGIYWNNHHHLIKACRGVTGGIMWANLHLLFWLSLLPFATSWMGENHFTRVPSAAYGLILLLSAIAYYILQTLIVRAEGGQKSKLSQAIGRDWKGKLSPVLYLLGILLSLIEPMAAGAIYVGVALLWFIPDRRLEHVAAE